MYFFIYGRKQNITGGHYLPTSGSWWVSDSRVRWTGRLSGCSRVWPPQTPSGSCRRSSSPPASHPALFIILLVQCAFTYLSINILKIYIIIRRYILSAHKIAIRKWRDYRSFSNISLKLSRMTARIAGNCGQAGVGFWRPCFHPGFS